MVPLESSTLFCKLTASELQNLRAVVREKSFNAGEIIFQEGDQGDAVYIVKEGLVQISAVVSSGERRLLSRVPPGEIFGEMAVLDNDPRSASATAEVPTVVYTIPRAGLLELLEVMPGLSALLIREISRRLREFNRQYIDEVLQAERLSLVGRFARSIVHDLKNPLNIIGLSAEMAGMEGASVESRQAAKNRIRKQVDRISSMVNELLEFTRGTRTAFVLGPVDYRQFVEQLAAEIRPELDIKSVTLELENQPPAVDLRLNPARMTRVFHNLIHNATDAMSEGGKLVLRFRTTAEAIITEVQDSGPGIPAELDEKLFQAFATHGKATGTGLGLSISKKIIEDHGGSIQARNAPGGGAIFSFHLPLPS